MEYYQRISGILRPVCLWNNTVIFLHDGPGFHAPILFKGNSTSKDVTNFQSFSFVIFLYFCSSSIILQPLQTTDIGKMSEDVESSVFLTYHSIMVKDFLFLPNGLVSFPFERQTEANIYTAYYIKAPKGLHSRLTIHKVDFTGTYSHSCEYGGAAIYDIYNNIPEKVITFCGQPFTEAFPTDFPKLVSFVSSGNSFILVYSVHQFYSSIFMSIELSYTKCKGHYPHNFLTGRGQLSDSVI